MPRLRVVAKVVAAFMCFIVLLKVVNQKPPPPPKTAPPAPPKPPTEEELMEKAKREDWIWKDFTTYVLASYRLVLPATLADTDKPRLDQTRWLDTWDVASPVLRNRRD